ncbi:hypothetical protein [Streptomyces fungicidicus]|uniref:hypothetical protein n=1 Tax=Streptomyces fungicidicus TaxID=68203 RepID=UPI00331843E7
MLPAPQVPPVLLELSAHVSGYGITVAKGEQGDHSQHLSGVPFPSNRSMAVSSAGAAGRGATVAV